ncbi:MAG: hypothetical protein ABJA02_14570 [Acidobacteriota bacterium]
MKRLLSLSALVLLIAASAFADIARPEPTKVPKNGKSIDTTMIIRLDKNATEARLIIPRSQIKQLRAELQQMDDDSDATAAVTSPSAISRTQTIVSGLLLSLAIVFGGVWFVRSGKTATRTGKTLVIAVVTLGVASAATYVYANAGPPAEARSITGKMFSQAVHFYNFGSGKIRIESGTESQVELIVPDPQPAATASSDE